MPDLKEILQSRDDIAKHLVINYRHIPAPENVLPAIVDPCHATPVPGGISAEIIVTWTAKSPVLVGGEKNAKNILEPQRLFPGGPFCLPGSALRGMVKAAYMVATNSAFTPLNKKHGIFPRTAMFDSKLPKDDDGHPDRRQKHAVTRLKVFNSRDGSPESPQSYTNATKNMYTIAEVATRTYGDEAILDWATALFGFVKNEANEDHWNRPVEHEAKALKSRVEFSFAVAPLRAGLPWPSTYLAIPGASPKLTFEAGYLTNPATDNTGTLWSSATAKLAGLKVYPVFTPNKEHQVALKCHNNRNAGTNDTKLRFATKSRQGPLVFTGEIHCHNLHPLEFGAFIWALTLGDEIALTGRNGNEVSHLHNIGHLKAFGMGLLEVSVTGGRVDVNPTETSGQVKKDAEFAQFCVESMQEFLNYASLVAARHNRNLFLQYKNPEAGNRLRDAGLLKPIPPVMPDGQMADLGRKYIAIRKQKQVINQVPFIP